MRLGLCIIFLLICSPVYGQSGVLVSKPHLLDVRTPEELGRWMMYNLTYQAEGPGADYWKSPEETLNDKGGDCEDFAILVQGVLKELGIDSQLIYVGLPTMGHMLCFYRMDNGKLAFFSNQYLMTTNYSSVTAVLDVWFPDWLRVANAEVGKKYSNWQFNDKQKE